MASSPPRSSSRRASLARLHCAAALLLALILASHAQSATPNGQAKRSAGKAHSASSAAPNIEVLFTPEQNAERAITLALQRARREVLVQAYSLTNKNIARALQRARARGLQVEVLIDRAQFEKGGAFVARDLLAAKIGVFLDGQHAAAHNKVIIIDGQSEDAVVFTGSFNFTYAAQRQNAENVLVLRAQPALAQRYRENWQRHRAHSVRLD